MNKEIFVKEAFAVIGKEAFSWDGDGLLPILWNNMYERQAEIEDLIMRGEDGKPEIWGVMSSKWRDFQPWEENGSIGLICVGYQCAMDAEAPKGWSKWIVPGFEYAKYKIEGDGFFYRALEDLKADGMQQVGACHLWSDPDTKEMYFCFPVRKLDDFAGDANKLK